jgi:hypothetical protein
MTGPVTYEVDLKVEFKVVPGEEPGDVLARLVDHIQTEAYCAYIGKARPALVTKAGRVLTDADIDELADEAERGYDVSRLTPRNKE